MSTLKFRTRSMNLQIRVNVFRRFVDGRTFVTVIRAPGVPATVHTVSGRREPGNNGPLLKPYPNWSYYENNNCHRSITNVYRVAVSTRALSCNRALSNAKPTKLVFYRSTDATESGSWTRDCTTPSTSARPSSWCST